MPWWSEDPVKDAELYWAELDSIGPACTMCGETLEGHGYRIGGGLICPACLDKYYREEI